MILISAMNKDIENIRIEDFDYPLDDERIAKHPLAERDQCRLLVHNCGGNCMTRYFYELPELLPANTMLVYNNTRVINARLRFRKGGDGALIEVFCLEPYEPCDYAVNFASKRVVSWKCFVGNSKRWKQGVELALEVGDTILKARRTGRQGNASIVELSWDNPAMSFAEVIAAAGEIPIPPYLNRGTEDSDVTDYQTVFSRIDGSVAAPTAGLHFTPAVLEQIDRRGIQRREVTLHVGAGTFQPVKSDTIGGHDMHGEFIAVERDFIAELATTASSVVAVGTTSVRTLESLYHIGCMIYSGTFDGTLPQWYPYSDTHPRLSVADALGAILAYLGDSPALLASTRLMIAPGYDYRIVKGIITNFHQPRSTLLLLVSAFLGNGDEWRQVYDYALAGGYRFLSYGDACLFLPSQNEIKQ